MNSTEEEEKRDKERERERERERKISGKNEKTKMDAKIDVRMGYFSRSR